MHRPDFSVVQIALQALRGDGRRMAALRHWLATTRVGQVRRMAVALGHELNRLMDATDPSENKMFLNVVGGAAESEVLAVVTKELAEAGLESTIVLGPLLMKTNGKETAARGGQSIVLPMPILVTSTYTVMQKASSLAYKRLSEGGNDPEMVMGKERQKLKIGHHSWRRLASTVAAETLARGDCTETDINLHFGWMLKKYAKKMQLQYADRGKRTARAKLMEMM